jgi:hypothetical protein
MPALPAAAVMLASLACSLVGRPSPPPDATSTAAPTTVSVSRSARDLLELAVPSAIGGVEVVIASINGDELDPEAMDALAQAYGVDPAQVELAIAADESGMAYQAGVIRVPGRNWAAVLDALAGTGTLGSGATYEWVDMGGRRILRAQSADDPALPSVHYAALGDAVFYVQSSDDGAVETSVEALPEDAGEGSSGGWEPPVPGTFPLMLTVVERPRTPVCVGEPAGRQWLKVMAIDTGYGVPYPYTTYSVTGRLMDSADLPFQTGPMAIFPYAAERYGADGREEVRVDAVSLMGGHGQATVIFDVQHCLYGTWQDDERVVRITPPFSDSVTAEVIDGTLCGEEGGIDFSGVLSGDRLTGDDLTVCNPDECVDPGLLPPSATVPFTAQVSDDGWSVSFDWTGDFYQFDEDAQGNIVSCTKTSTEDHQFTITRLTFGE